MTDLRAMLLEAAVRGELHHAVILHGPSSTELRAMGLELARRMICPSRSGEDGCASCSKADRGIHPDLTIISPQAERKSIAVEQIRNLVATASMRPYEGRAKVFVLDPADAMSHAAANSLLKTLEEPTADTFFLLLTRSPDLLLPTIRSRSQLVAVGAIGARSAAAIASAEGMSLQAARIHRDHDSFGLTAEDAESFAREAIRALHRYAKSRETAALLALSALIASEEPNGRIAVLATVLRDLEIGRAHV